MTRRLVLWLKIAIAAVLLAVMLHVVKPREIIDTLKNVRLEMVLIGALLMPVNIGLQEYKWRYLVRLVKPDTKPLETTGSLLGGMAFGVATPGRLGEYGRGLFISGVKPWNLVGLTVIDKFYNLGMTIAFGLPALLTLPWAWQLTAGGWHLPMFSVILLIDGMLLFLALDPRPVRSLIYAIQIMLPKGDKIAQLTGGMERFSFRDARIVLLLTAAHYAVYLLQFHFMLNGFHALPLLPSARGAAAVLFSKSALPISIAGLGLDQLVSVQFFGQFGAFRAAAFNASLLVFIVNVLIPSLAGLFFISRLQIPASGGKDS